MTDHQIYREWSAAYVLGALESSERGLFEAHLAGCEECRRDVASFAPLPGMLARIDTPQTTPAPERIAERAVARVRSEWAAVFRSRRRWRWATPLASAAAAVALIMPATTGDDTPEATVLTLEPGALATGHVALEARGWGTAVTIELDALPRHDLYVAWVVTGDGEWQQVAAWGPTPAARARLTGASSYATSELVRVVITAEDRESTIAAARVGDA